MGRIRSITKKGLTPPSLLPRRGNLRETTSPIPGRSPLRIVSFAKITIIFKTPKNMKEKIKTWIFNIRMKRAIRRADELANKQKQIKGTPEYYR